MKTELDKIIYEEKNNIGYLIINDPPANKMTNLFWDELYYIVTEKIDKSKIKGIIITGKGRHFSSGAEVDNLKKCLLEETAIDNNNILSYSRKNERDRFSFEFFYNLDIPVISAINGFCIGSALELALSTHIRIAGDKAIFSSPESTFGIMPGVGGTLGCLETCGLGRAIEVIMGGQTFTSQEAMKLGIVHNVVNKREILFYCEKLIEYISNTGKKYCKNYAKSYVELFSKIN